MAEFTGERLIPGEVDIDLLNEHMARYHFAVRLARGKRVLDAGCGAGYGSAELADVAETRHGHRYRARGRGIRARALRAAQSRVRTGVVHRTALRATARSTWWWHSK